MTRATALQPAFALATPLRPSAAAAPLRRASARRARQLRRCTPSAKMVRVSVPVSVEAPPDFCHLVFSDLSRMPAWSSTLESVTRDAEDPAFSEWVFSWNGIRLSWRARDDEEEEDALPPGEDALVPPDELTIRWRSVSGLNHVGAVEFVPVEEEKTTVVMTVDYDIASLLAAVMQSGFVSTFVESAIESDLQRFRKYTLRSLRKERISQKRS